MMYINIPRFDVPELITDANDARIAREVRNNVRFILEIIIS